MLLLRPHDRPTAQRPRLPLLAALLLLAAPCPADEVVLRDGTVHRGRAREIGLRVEVEGPGATVSVPAGRVERIRWSRPEAWLTPPPAWPDEVRALPDLDVTFLEVLPRIADPALDEPWSVARGPDPPRPAAPPGRRACDPVTIVAHLWNRGTGTIRDVSWEFRLDGRIEDRGRLAELLPGRHRSFPLRRPWNPSWKTASFEVITRVDERNREIADRNNRRTVPLRAVPVLAGAPPGVVRSFARARNMTGSFSFDDWIAEHVEQANRLLDHADPGGALPRFRLDGVCAEPDPEAFGRRLRRPGDEAPYRVAGLYVTQGPAPLSTEALPVRWDLVRRLFRAAGAPDPRPFLPAVDPDGPFHGLLTAGRAAPLSALTRAALSVRPPPGRPGRALGLPAPPAEWTVEVRDSRGRPATAVRVRSPSAGAEGPADVHEGPCDEEGRFRLRCPGPPWLHHPRSGSLPLAPLGRLAREGRGWLRVEADTAGGAVERGALTLPALWLAARGVRPRVVVRTR